MMSSSSGSNPLAATAAGSGALPVAAAPAYGEAAAARRKVLTVVVGCLLQEAGFISVEKPALGTLVEMLQSTIVEMGRLSRGYCELAYRSEPLGADIILALADMGINYDGLQSYSRRAGRSIVPPPQVQPDTKQHTILQVGDKKPHLPHIPDNLPPFPDTHTYCFTPTVKQPVTEYEAIREKAAMQKRDIEKALTKFATKTNATESLFITEDKEFALVCVAPTPSQNIDALMPRDQVFEAELDYSVSKARKKRQDRLTSFQQPKTEPSDADQDMKSADIIENDVADNPYLQPVKAPRVILTTNRHNNSSHHTNDNNLYNDPSALPDEINYPEPSRLDRHNNDILQYPSPRRQQGEMDPVDNYCSSLGNNISRIVLGSANSNADNRDNTSSNHNNMHGDSSLIERNNDEERHINNDDRNRFRNEDDASIDDDERQHNYSLEDMDDGFPVHSHLTDSDTGHNTSQEHAGGLQDEQPSYTEDDMEDISAMAIRDFQAEGDLIRLQQEQEELQHSAAAVSGRDSDNFDGYGASTGGRGESGSYGGYGENDGVGREEASSPQYYGGDSSPYRGHNDEDMNTSARQHSGDENDGNNSEARYSPLQYN